MLSIETVSVTIDRPFSTVYDFLADPRNLVRWVDVLGAAHHPVAPMEWMFDRPAFHSEPIRVRFTPRNAFGVLDIHAYSGEALIHWAPVRAIDLGDATAVTFGLVHGAEWPASHSASERDWIEADLLTLKTLLEAT